MFRTPPAELVDRHHALVDEKRLEGRQPALVVLRRALSDLFDQPGAEFVPGVGALLVEDDRHPESASFPGRFEHQLPVLARRRRAAVDVGSARIDARHRLASAGTRGRATPIMQSRLTIDAGCSSVQPPVPSGRSGSTMERRSELESHTFTATSAGSATPDTSNTQ